MERFDDDFYDFAVFDPGVEINLKREKRHTTIRAPSAPTPTVHINVFDVLAVTFNTNLLGGILYFECISFKRKSDSNVPRHRVLIRAAIRASDSSSLPERKLPLFVDIGNEIRDSFDRTPRSAAKASIVPRVSSRFVSSRSNVALRAIRCIEGLSL